jgi:hypothetical protein
MPQLVTRERVEREIAFPRPPMMVAKALAALSATGSDASWSSTRAMPSTTQSDAGRHELSPETTRRADRDIAAAHNAAGAVPTLPLQELSRVTEHVIKQLDRRVLSYRERTGRI